MSRATAFTLAASLLATAATAQEPKTPLADKAIGEAMKLLEGTLAAAEKPDDKAKLQAAIAALRGAGGSKIQNDIISDFVDNEAKYVGQTLTFRLRFIGGNSLGGRRGDEGVPFEGQDSKNRAKLLLGLYIPRDLKVPNAGMDEYVIVTFKVGPKGKSEAVEIRRP